MIFLTTPNFDATYLLNLIKVFLIRISKIKRSPKDSLILDAPVENCVR